MATRKSTPKPVVSQAKPSPRSSLDKASALWDRAQQDVKVKAIQGLDRAKAKAQEGVGKAKQVATQTKDYAKQHPGKTAGLLAAAATVVVGAWWLRKKLKRK